jgi:hypothetical protein
MYRSSKDRRHNARSYSNQHRSVRFANIFLLLSSICVRSFGLLVLAPVTIKEIQFRRKVLARIPDNEIDSDNSYTRIPLSLRKRLVTLVTTVWTELSVCEDDVLCGHIRAGHPR